jgi:hypothetical protein
MMLRSHMTSLSLLLLSCIITVARSHMTSLLFWNGQVEAAVKLLLLNGTL